MLARAGDGGSGDRDADVGAAGDGESGGNVGGAPLSTSFSATLTIVTSTVRSALSSCLNVGVLRKAWKAPMSKSANSRRRLVVLMMTNT